MTVRPNFADLFRTAQGRRVGGRPDLSVSSLAENRTGSDPEQSAGSAGLVPPLTYDPVSPADGEQWLRVDRSPVEYRVYAAGRVWRTILEEAPPDASGSVLYPHGELYPQQTLYPRSGLPLYPVQALYPSSSLYPN